ncbi:hypothetical protein PCASD_04812 [Puccinia coronata f. sp. avenae]|uniref:Uncharacterized protein n=1 Tax=Puccinia coronata f. sp. avenae TaxID=200324 RepID=A0A2N5V750_9BASI|nr:hypothetical protein PCASD_04812 [Puccinia coronata f. sp. avenae]
MLQAKLSASISTRLIGECPLPAEEYRWSHVRRTPGNHHGYIKGLTSPPCPTLISIHARYHSTILTSSSTYPTVSHPHSAPTKKDMEANSTPGDLERAEDSPGSSPGGVRPVEEPVVPQPPHPSSPTANQEQGEALGAPDVPMAPHAEPLHEGDMIELPEELNDAIAALLARVNNDPDAFSNGMFIDIEGDRIVGTGEVDFDPAREEGLLALVRHLEALPEAHPEHLQPVDRPTWEQLMETLNPETQAIFRTFYDDMQRLLADLTANPNRTVSDAEIPGHPVDPDDMQRALPDLDPATAQLIADYLEEVRDALNQAAPIASREAENLQTLGVLFALKTMEKMTLLRSYHATHPTTFTGPAFTTGYKYLPSHPPVHFAEAVFLEA